MKVATNTLEESIKTFETFLSERAYQEGYAAYLAGAERTAIPDRLCVFSGNWVEGWIAAAHDATASAESSGVQAVAKSFRIPLVNSSVNNLRPLCLN